MERLRTMFYSNKLNSSGFSLVELLAVISIIGILSVIGIPQYQKFRAKAFQAEAKGLLAAIAGAEQVFYLEYDGYHSSLNVLGVLPAGKTRYNVGFGSAGVLSPNYGAAYQGNSINSKHICTGAFGLGSDNSCDMFIATPEISGASTVTQTNFVATAVAYEELLTADNGQMPKLYQVGFNLVFGMSAFAASIPGSEIGLDSWLISSSKKLEKRYLSPQAGCFEAGLCTTEPVQPGE